MKVALENPCGDLEHEGARSPDDDIIAATDKIITQLATTELDCSVTCELLYDLAQSVSEGQATAANLESWTSNHLPALISLVNHRSCFLDHAPDIAECYCIVNAVAAVINSVLRGVLNAHLHELELDAPTTSSQGSMIGLVSLNQVLLASDAEKQHFLDCVEVVAATSLNDSTTHSQAHESSHEQHVQAINKGSFSEQVHQHRSLKTPGGAALLAVGGIGLLRVALSHRVHADCYFVPHRARLASPGASQKLVAMLCHDAEKLQMPDGALVQVLFEVLLLCQDNFCRPLLNSAAALSVLARPLQHLATHPKAYQDGPFAYHAQVLVYLCQWTASLHGLAGVQRLSKSFTEPAASALTALLELDAGHHSGAAHLVRSCALLLTHMASTTHGRRVLKSHGCFARWLVLASRWQAQGIVLQHVALLVRAPLVDYSAELYFSPLNQEQEWRLGLVCVSPGTCSLLQSPLGSQVVPSIAALLRVAGDTSGKAILIDMLARICQVQPACCPDAVPALLKAARPDAATPRADNAGDLEQYLEAAGLTWEASQQAALAVAIRSIEQEAQRARVLAEFDRAALPCGRVPQPLLQSLLLGWLQHYASQPIWESDPMAHQACLDNLELAITADILSIPPSDRLRVVQACVAVLQRARSAQQCTSALRLLRLMATPIAMATDTAAKSDDVAKQLWKASSWVATRLAEPRCLDAILGCVEGRLGHIDAASGGSWMELLTAAGEFKMTVDREDPDMRGACSFVDFLSTVVASAACWLRELDVPGHMAAITRLLRCDPLWFKVRAFVVVGPFKGDSTLRFLADFVRGALAVQHEPLRRMVEEVVEILGEARLEELGHAVEQSTQRHEQPQPAAMMRALGAAGFRLPTACTTAGFCSTD